MTEGKRRFGQKRVPGCYCDYNFTCGPCLGGPPRPAPEPEPEEDDFDGPEKTDQKVW